jgi:7,8-dihydropterin-6-yl-methyl-4-(beta-D-ribofuranosyl)aminobenzene 5'-phosphate synthase
LGEAVCTTLVDNRAEIPDLDAEHGFSALIRTAEGMVLFDTGQTGIVVDNSVELGIDLSRVRHVVISHGHYDHVGGLPRVLQLLGKATLHVHPDMSIPEFILAEGGGMGRIGVPEGSHVKDGGIVWQRSRKPEEIVAGIFVSGSIPDVTGFEIEASYTQAGGHGGKAEVFAEEQALFVVTENGVSVITGCAHRGIINTLRLAREVTGREEIYAVIGGMHLGSAAPERIGRTVAEFERLDPRYLYPCHCTGLAAIGAMEEAFPGRCFYNAVGKCIEL